MARWNIFDYHTIHKFVNDTRALIEALGDEEICALLGKVEEILKKNIREESLVDLFQDVKNLSDDELLSKWVSYYDSQVIRDYLMISILQNELFERDMESEMERVMKEAFPDGDKDPLKA